MARISVVKVEGGVVLEMGKHSVTSWCCCIGEGTARVVVGQGEKVGIAGTLGDMALRAVIEEESEVVVFGRVVDVNEFHEVVENVAFCLLAPDKEGMEIDQDDVDEVVRYLESIE